MVQRNPRTGADEFVPMEHVQILEQSGLLNLLKVPDNMMIKSLDDVDQKIVFKVNMEMKMDIQVIPRDDSAQNTLATGDVKFSMQTKACSRNGIHGFV